MNFSRLILVLASFVIVVAGMRVASPILVPFLLAIFVAVVATPPFLLLRKHGVPSGVALGGMILVLVLAAVFGVGMVSRAISDFTQKMPEYQQKLEGYTQGLVDFLHARGMEAPEQAVAEALDPKVAMRFVSGLLGALTGMLSKTFLILLIVVFILLEAAILPRKLRGLPGMTDDSWGRVEEILGNIRQYMAVKSMLSVLTGVLVVLWLLVLGIDFPILLGLLVIVLNYVPSIGSVIAAIPAVVLALVEFGPLRAGIVAVGYIVINVVIGNIIEPRVMGRRMGLSPLVILVSLIFWGWVLGPVGMLLSVPLTMTVRIAMECSADTRGLALLMGTAAETGSGCRRVGGG